MPDIYDLYTCEDCGQQVYDNKFDRGTHEEQYCPEIIRRKAVEANLFGPCGYEASLNEEASGPGPWDDSVEVADIDAWHDAPLATPTVALEDIAEAWFPDNWGDLYVPSSFQQTFADVYHTAFTLLVERQKKYGPENIDQLGLWGVFGRMGDDKINRLRRAFNGTIKGGKIEIDLNDGHGDESVDDTLLDIANYALIMYALKHGLWGKPLEEDM